MLQLAEGGALSPALKDHPLSGNQKGRRACHVAPDWVLVYTLKGDDLVFVRTGTHADLFAL